MFTNRHDFGQPVSEPSTGRYGVYSARVVDNRDPLLQGRLKIVFEGQEYWARLATLIAGSNQGSWFIPDINNEVLVAFEGGDADKPYVIGALWNALDRPPETMDAEGNNNRKILRSRTGVKITLDDQNEQENFIHLCFFHKSVYQLARDALLLKLRQNCQGKDHRVPTMRLVPDQLV